MSYIMIVDDDVDVCDVLEMIVNSQFEYDVVKLQSANHAIEHLKGHTDIVAIITDYRMYDGSGADLYKFVRKNMPAVPVCLVSTHHARDLDGFKTIFEDNPLNNALVKPFRPDDVLRFVEYAAVKDVDAAVVPLPKAKKEDNEKKYNKVNVNSFLETPVPGNVYLKINNEKFVKIKKSEDGDDNESIKKYLEKDVQDIYLESSDYDVYVRAKIMNLFKDGKVKTYQDDDKVIPEIESIEQIHMCILELGVNEKTIHLVDKNIELTLQSIEHEKFDNIMDKLDRYNNYLYAHSYLTAYISRHIAEGIRWSGYFVNRKDVEKALVVAALFQNISLTDDSRLAEIDELNDKRWNNLSDEDKEKLKSHTIESYNIVRPLIIKYKHIGNLIVNHHERPAGRGFPSGISGRELDLHEAIFIISNNFSHDLLRKNLTHKEIRILAQSYNEVYDQEGVFQTAYRSFLNSFDKIFS